MANETLKLFLSSNVDMFPTESLAHIKQLIIDNPEKVDVVVSLPYKNPTTALLLAFLLGGFAFDRFYLNQPGLAVLKIITCGGFWIWWLWDVFTACSRAREYNKELLMKHICM